MKNAKKILAILLALVMTLSLFAACGNDVRPVSAPENTSEEVSVPEAQEDKGEEGEESEEAVSDTESEVFAEDEEELITISYPLVDEEVVLTQWGSMNPNNFNYISTLSENAIISALADKTGVRVECTSVAGGPEVMDQFTLMTSAGDLPDFIDNVQSCYTAGGDAAINDGIIIDLGPYLDEYCPDFLRLFDEMDGLRTFAHTDDGAVPYFIEASMNADAVCTSGYLIRQDWLDQLNMDTPETFDDLHDVLAAFKNDLGVDSPLWLPRGVTGLLSEAYGCAVTYEPMAGAYPFMAVDGEVVCGYTTDEFKGFLKIMNQWYSEGLIWQDFVTDNMAFGITTSSAYNKFLNSQMGCAYGELADITSVAEQIGDGAVLSAIPDPSANGEKNHLTVSATPYYSKWAISTDCEEVELACQFMNYMYTEEGCNLLTYGVEGEACVKNADGTFSYTDLILNNPDGISYSNAYHIYTFLDEVGLRDLTAQRQFYDETALKSSDVWSGSRDAIYTYPSASLTAEENEEFSAAFVTISTYVSECIPKFVLGDLDVDADFDEFLATIESMGIKDCTAIKQAAYDRYVNR